MGDSTVDEKTPSHRELPSKQVLEEAGNITIKDKDGNEIPFKSLYLDKPQEERQLIVFVRHFFCGVCSPISITHPVNVLNHPTVVRDVQPSTRRRPAARKARRRQREARHHRLRTPAPYPRLCRALERVLSHLCRAQRPALQEAGHDLLHRQRRPRRYTVVHQEVLDQKRARLDVQQSRIRTCVVCWTSESERRGMAVPGR